VRSCPRFGQAVAEYPDQNDAGGDGDQFESEVVFHGELLCCPHNRTFELPKPEKKLPKNTKKEN